MGSHSRHETRRKPSDKTIAAAVAGVVVLVIMLLAFAMNAGSRESSSSSPASPPLQSPATALPTATMAPEHHIEEAAATPVDRAATSASEQVQRDRQSVVSNARVQAVQMRLNEAVGDTPLGFGPDTATLTPESRDKISAVAAVLRDNPNSRMEIVGHTAVEISDPALCLQLSQLRAEQIASQLSMQGVDPNRLTAIGVSHSQPKDTAYASRRAELLAI